MISGLLQLSNVMLPFAQPVFEVTALSIVGVAADSRPVAHPGHDHESWQTPAGNLAIWKVSQAAVACWKAESCRVGSVAGILAVYGVAVGRAHRGRGLGPCGVAQTGYACRHRLGRGHLVGTVGRDWSIRLAGD